MRPIDLLPPAYAERRRAQRNVFVAIVAAIVIVLLLLGWWFLLGMQISDARRDLAEVQAQNADLERQIAELQRFADLEREVQEKRTALQTVMAGDIDWPALLTEVAMVIPGEVWLRNLQTSAGMTEGAAPAATEGNAVRISQKIPVGRVLFTGRSISLPGVAKWLIRLDTVKDFAAIWLNSATKDEVTTLVDFDSTIELGEGLLSHRFEKVLP